MLKKTITYTDYNDVEQTEDFYFHLSKADLAEMTLSHDGDLRKYLQQIVEDNDGSQIISTFKDIISKSVGVRSDDGRRFEKSDQISKEFMQTAAYEELFMELVTDATAGLTFVRGILPATLVMQADAAEEPKEYSHAELLAMSTEDFNRIVGNDPKNMSRDYLLVAMERKNRLSV